MNETIARQQIVVAGLPIEYLTAGEGAPLLLLHGIADSAYSWEKVIPQLARTHRIYAPSLPGFGTSGKEIGDRSPEFYTSFVDAFLGALDIDRFSIAGNSLGGLVAMRLALAIPNRVNNLILIDSAGLGRELSIALRLMTLPGMTKIISTIYRNELGAKIWAFAVSSLLFANPTRVPSDWRDRLYQMAKEPGYLEATVGATKGGNTVLGQRDREIMLEQLSRLTMPTLIIWGTSDRILPVRQARIASAHLQRGQLVLLPDCGHVPQLEQPERVGTVINEFLNDTAVLLR